MQPSQGKITFRVIANEDADFVYRVYCGTRDWEFQYTVWPADEKERFLRQQFEAQDASYQLRFPRATRRIIQIDGIDIGRIILERQDDCLRLIDLSLLPEWRGRGIGGDILRSLLNEALGGKVPMRLHVMKTSPALALYLRHGFRRIGESGHHYALEWQPDLRPAEV